MSSLSDDGDALGDVAGAARPQPAKTRVAVMRTSDLRISAFLLAIAR